MAARLNQSVSGVAFFIALFCICGMLDRGRDPLAGFEEFGLIKQEPSTGHWIA